MVVMKQQREEVSVRVYTLNYRIYGKMHLIPKRSTTDLFNLEQHEFVPLTEVQLFSPGFVHPPLETELRGRLSFLSLNRHDVIWVLGGRPLESRASTVKDVRVGFVFDGYLMTGVLHIPINQRLSDYLYSSRGAFVNLFGTRLFQLDGETPFPELQLQESFEFVTVNMARATAVFEG